MIRRRSRSRSASGTGTADSSAIVYGWRGAREQRIHGRHLHELAQVHHRHPIGDVADDREVMGDEQVGQPELRLEALEQVDDLGLDGHVERGDGLVAHDQLRLHGERPGDADALPLAAAELVRVAIREPAVEVDQLQQLRDAALAVTVRRAARGSAAARR